jgi:hypothetical protein
MRAARLLSAALLAAVVGGCSGTSTAQYDAGPLPLDDGCGETPSLAWIAALRAQALARPGALVSPGVSLDDARAFIAADATAQALVARARAQVEADDPALPVGDAEAYLAVASRALAVAFVAWVDGDAALAARARGLLSLAAIDAAWLADAEEVPIRIGGALVGLAGAADLLAASGVLSDDDVAGARADVGRAASALDSWAQDVGPAFLLATSNNHNVRLGAGLLAAGLVTGAADLDDEAVAYGLAQIVATVHDSQSGFDAGWAEGPTYFEYAFEVGAPPLAALVPVWPLPGRGCLTCPAHTGAPCAEGAVLALLPLGDDVLRRAIEWFASLETAGGWFAEVDDSRENGAPAPLLERLADERLFRAWSVDGPGNSVGGSPDMTPFVAFALVAPPARTQTPAAVWPAAGSARVDVAGADGASLEAFLFAEGELAQRGRGHERPDPLSLVLAVDGLMLLGGSGYGHYDERAPLARADASSLITVDGRLPDDEGVTAPGPAAVMTAVDGGVQGQMTVPDVDVLRLLGSAESEVVIADRVQLAAAHEIGWHWHLRGEVTAGPDGSGWTWSRDGRTCVAVQTGGADWLTSTLETAPDVDRYDQPGEHPVVRQRAALAPGDYSLVTLVACTRVVR